MRFHTHFAVETDPANVYLEMDNAPTDYSGSDALGRITALYAAQGKTLTVEITGAGSPLSPSPPVVAVVPDETPSTHMSIEKSAEQGLRT